MLIYDPKEPQKIRDLIFLTVVVCGFGYAVINMFVPNEDMIIACRVLQAAASVMVLAVYGSDAIRALRTPTPSRTDFLLLGISCGWLASLSQSLYSILYRLAGAPAWMLTIEIVAPTVLLSVIGALLHVAAPGAFDGNLPRRNKIAIGAMFGAAALVVFGLLVYRPDISDWVERTPWWLRDMWETGALYPAQVVPS